MFDNTVTRLPGGVSNSRENGILSDLPVNERISKLHEYSNDFDQYVAGDWTQTLNGGTVALTAGDGGLLLITTAVSVLTSIQKNPTDFTFAAARRTWARHQVQLDSLVGVALVGLLNVTTTPFTGASQTDGIYFLSTVTTGALTINYAVAGVIVSQAMGISLVAAQPATLSFYYDGGQYEGDGTDRIVWEATGAGVTASARGSMTVSATSAFPGATAVTPTLAVNATTAVARTLTVDSVYFAKDRVNINATPAF